MVDSFESSLAYPLAGPQETEAPYKYNYLSFTMIGEFKPDMRFYHRDETQNVWNELPLKSTYPRQKWIVGIGYNTFRFVRSSLRGHLRILGAQLKLAHWGVYLRPANGGNEEERPYHMFGMNFRDNSKHELLLENTWRTKQGGVTRLKESDFEKHGEDQYTDIEIYCSLEEFILTAQMLLVFICFDERNLLERKKHTGGVADMFVGHFINGESYELLNRNCQHFSKSILKYLHDCKWGDPKRLNTEFSLERMQATIRRNTGEVVAKTMRNILIAPEKEFDKKMTAFWEQVQRTGPTEVKEWDSFMKKKDLWRQQHLSLNAGGYQTKKDFEIRLV